MVMKTENETELVRSTVTLDVVTSSSENWKLALVMMNLQYQLPSKSEDLFELKAYEKDESYINGTFMHRNNSF